MRISSSMKIDSYLSGFFLVGGSIALAILGLLAVRRVLHAKSLISSHDVGGYLLSVTGTLYAVILGLIVVDSMAKFQQARVTTEQESNALANVILLSNQLPREERLQIQQLALAYIDHVIQDEWPIMDQGKYAPEARWAAIHLIDAVCDFEPKTEKEQTIHAAELTAICEFWNSRRSRTITAAHGIPALEWVILLLGGIITVAFTYFFKLEHLKIQIVMTAMVATIIALNLYLVLMFGNPYSGDLKISPDSFKVIQAIIAHQAGPLTTPPKP
jgi:Protein of unknown function (DUF4239)